MNRRAFLKMALVVSGAAVGDYFGPQLLDMANSSVQSLDDQMQFGATSFTADGWKIPHLLRRAGFGASPAELAYFESLGISAATDQLLNYESIDASNLPDKPNITMEFTRKPPTGEIVNLVWWWVYRMVDTPRPLEEKMALFWHNHFTTAIYKVRSPYT